MIVRNGGALVCDWNRLLLDLQVHTAENALFVEHGEDTVAACSDELDHWLVVDVVDVGKLNSLRNVDLLLQFEGVVVEELLKHLVRIVDAKLLERVVLEDFKSKDVENLGWVGWGWGKGGGGGGGYGDQDEDGCIV